MAKNCEVCGEIMENPDLTHCSDECLFESVKSSKSVFSEDRGWRLENFETSFEKNQNEIDFHEE